MSSDQQLGAYLNDHLAGAHAGVDMAHQLQKDVAGGPDAALLGPIGDEIAEDLETLQRLMSHLGIRHDPVKQATGWLAEKAHRVGVAVHARHGSDVSRLLAAESLSLGVEGKLALWLALCELVPTRPELARFDIAGLAERARDQRARIEAVRLAAARRAFGAAAEPPPS